jgi:hypothetical protein
MNLARILASIIVLAASTPPSRAGFAWPTPNRAWEEGGSYGDFVQPTGSGQTESGMFGCVRNGGRRFHEGLDLATVGRDRRGEATDPVFAIFEGTVLHASTTAGHSSYGRYVVIEHRDLQPSVVSLYAHLRSIAPEVRPGRQVQPGDTLGIMGRSAAGYSIPREQAHLHLEVGLWLSERFQRWYDGRKFGSRNEHGFYNGMNIVGFDYLDFLERRRAGEVGDLREYLARVPTALTVLVGNRFVPDFVRRYPELVEGGAPATAPPGWRIDFTWFGLPKSWWPATGEEAARAPEGGVTILFHDQLLLERHPCQGVVSLRAGNPVLGPRAREVIDILFTGG